jgi:hypothetical protein
MPLAAKMEFERTTREFAQWRAVPEEDRSPAPVWWWQPAIYVVAQQQEWGRCCVVDCGFRLVRLTPPVPRC